MEAQDIAFTRWCCDVRDALRLSGLHNTFSPAFLPHTRKKPIRQDGLFHFI